MYELRHLPESTWVDGNRKDFITAMSLSTLHIYLITYKSHSNLSSKIMLNAVIKN